MTGVCMRRSWGHDSLIINFGRHACICGPVKAALGEATRPELLREEMQNLRTIPSLVGPGADRINLQACKRDQPGAELQLVSPFPVRLKERAAGAHLHPEAALAQRCPGRVLCPGGHSSPKTRHGAGAEERLDSATGRAESRERERSLPLQKDRFVKFLSQTHCCILAAAQTGSR